MCSKPSKISRGVVFSIFTRILSSAQAALGLFAAIFNKSYANDLSYFSHTHFLSNSLNNTDNLMTWDKYIDIFIF